MSTSSSSSKNGAPCSLELLVRDLDEAPNFAPGFSLLELLVALALALVVMAATAPLFVSLGQTAVSEADGTIGSLQGRVAVARLERDLRIASAARCPFVAHGPVLEASRQQVVFLQASSSEGPPLLVEWELTATGSLMRRWGNCPSSRPTTYPHSLFRDHKTMLERLRPSSCFRYEVAGGAVLDSVEQENLALVKAVLFDASTSPAGLSGSVRVFTTARVGR